MVKLTRSFELEIEMIDSDHRHLVDLINEITEAIDEDRLEDCARLVSEFVTFAKAHFAREEAMLAKNDYPKVGKIGRAHV